MKNKTWRRNEAHEFLAQIVGMATRHGFGVALGGSLAHLETSDNDLDLVFFPLKSESRVDHVALLYQMEREISINVRGAVDQGDEDDYKLVYVCRTADGRKLDLIFPTLQFYQRDGEFLVLKRRRKL